MNDPLNVFRLDGKIALVTGASSGMCDGACQHAAALLRNAQGGLAGVAQLEVGRVRRIAGVGGGSSGHGVLQHFLELFELYSC